MHHPDHGGGSGRRANVCPRRQEAQRRGRTLNVNAAVALLLCGNTEREEPNANRTRAEPSTNSTTIHEVGVADCRSLFVGLSKSRGEVGETTHSCLPSKYKVSDRKDQCVSPTEPSVLNRMIRTEFNRTEPNRTEPNRTEPNRTEPKQFKPNQTSGQLRSVYLNLHQNRTDPLARALTSERARAAQVPRRHR